MQYICPDLICPYCEKHTHYVIDKYLCWTSKQTCQNCGRTFLATSKLKDTTIKPYNDVPDKLDLEEDIFIYYNCYKKEKDNG